VFCAKNGIELDPDDDAAYQLVVAVAAGSLDEVGAIAEVLRSFAR
jgi:death-on-curing protein